MINFTYAVVYGCVVLLGLPLNAASLWILLRRHRLKSPSAVLMINLAFSDLLLVISLPMRVYFYAIGSWPFGVQTCIWFTMLFRNNIRASAIFITFIAVDRLLAVVFPLRSKQLRTTGNTWRACGLVWIGLVLANIPESIHLSINMIHDNVTTCFDSPGHNLTEVHSYIQSGLIFILLAVNVVSTAMVSLRLRRHLSGSGQLITNKMNVMLIFVMNLLMFVVFFLPVSLAFIVKDWRHVAMTTVCLASVNCCVDPLLYYFSLDSFWKKKDICDSSTFNSR